MTAESTKIDEFTERCPYFLHSWSPAHWNGHRLCHGHPSRARDVRTSSRALASMTHRWSAAIFILSEVSKGGRIGRFKVPV